MPFFKHTYHSARNYGEPFWTVLPGQVVEHAVNPEPNWFALVADDSGVERAVVKPATEKRSEVKPEVDPDVEDDAGEDSDAE